MSKNMDVALWLRLHGQQAVSAGFAKSKNSLDAMGRSARGATREFKHLYDSVNGFSAMSKGLAFVGGTALFRDAENTVLAFQRMQLELKQTAGLTNDQVKEISDYAKDSAAAMLSTPTAMLEGAMKLANAGMKWADLLPVLKQAARDAAAFRATVGDMANMDFDISTKMHIDASQLSDVHNMLLYHARSGRFEAPALSRGAPELFTYAEKVGLSGTQGLNLIGAMTQQVMKGVAPDQQSKVLTNFEQGFSHIVSPHYLKGLAKFGIDVKKYMPKGQFYGDGGVQGFTDLVKAMKAKGLEDPFKMAQAGFADKETKDFWFQMMRGVDGFGVAMREAAAAAKSGQTTKDREEIATSAVGKDAAARANWEKTQLSSESQVGVWENLKSRAAESPWLAAGAAVGVLGGARAVWKNRQAKNAASESAQQAANALRPQNVFVVNWPKQLGGTGALSNRPDIDGPEKPGAPGKEGKAAKYGKLAMVGAAAAAEAAAVGYASYQITSALMETKTGEEVSGWLANQAAKIMAAIGNEKAQQMVVNLNLDGQQITQVVEARQKASARRN